MTILNELSLTVPAKPELSYPIIIGSGLLQMGTTLREQLPYQQILVVSNETVAPLYLQQFKAQLANVRLEEVILRDGERYKTLDEWSRILDALMQAEMNRDAVVVALGGGVVGDMAGYAAASFQRGIDFVQVPTTLLAQVDSSVGGKTGINHPLGKNMIGAFHQPRAVIIDTETLKTLPPREFSAGMGEVIKYGLINDLPFFTWLETHIDRIMAHDEHLLAEMIAHCCRNKAEIVSADEQEHGQRALLNLGHTFGHSLEMLTYYTTWVHGEAVAIGTHIAARLAQQLGWLTQADVARIVHLFTQAGCPVTTGGELEAEAIYQAMFHDKKVRAGKLRLILPREMGKCEIVSDVPKAEILRAIAACA